MRKVRLVNQVNKGIENMGCVPLNITRLDIPALGYSLDDVKKTGGKSIYREDDYRDSVQWHNGTEWKKITTDTNAIWHLSRNVNFTPTSINNIPNTTNEIAAGRAGRIYNTSPDAKAGNDQSVKENEKVTLNATASTDTEDDIIGASWNQIEGPKVIIKQTKQPLVFTFKAPSQETRIRLQLIIIDRTDQIKAPNHKPTNSQGEDEIIITVEPKKEK